MTKSLSIKKCLIIFIAIAYMIFGVGLWSAKAYDSDDYYHITNIYDIETDSIINEDYYSLKSAYFNVIYTDLDEFYNNTGSYGKTSINTIRNNITKGVYDEILKEYPYYVIRAKNTYSNTIYFLKNSDDIVLFKDTTRSNERIDFYFGFINNYGYTYNRSTLSSEGFKSSSSFLYELWQTLPVGSSNNYLNYIGDDTAPIYYFSDISILEDFFGIGRTIELSKAPANDLDNNDVYIITADFENVFDAGLVYQIKIDDNEWLDITSELYERALNYGVYTYEYTAYWNMDFKARVLYQDGTVKTENSISITELNEFGIDVSYVTTKDDKDRFIALITANFENCWNDQWTYLYSYDSINYFPIVSWQNKKTEFKHAIQTNLFFKIVDKDNNTIYEQEYIKSFPLINKWINLKEYARVDENGKKYIEVVLDFSEYANVWDLYVNHLYYKINTTQQQGNFPKYTLNLYAKDEKTKYYISVMVDDYEVENLIYSIEGSRLLTFDEKYDQVQDDNLNEELGNGDFSTVGGMIETVKSFINAIQEFVVLFFQWIMRFFNGLNIWIRTALVGEFIVMIICKIIKVVRR